MRKILTQEEIINSQAYRILESMIQDRVDKLLSWQTFLDHSIDRAKNPSYMDRVYPLKENGKRDFDKQPINQPVYYKPTLDTGTSFDEDEKGKQRKVELIFELHELTATKSAIEHILKLKEEINDLNTEKLYLVAPDNDWQDDGRRYNRVFGKKV